MKLEAWIVQSESEIIESYPVIQLTNYNHLAQAVPLGLLKNGIEEGAWILIE